MRMFRMIAAALGLTTLAMVAGCGGGSIYVAASRPPEIALPQNIRTIAVTPFVGQDPISRSGAQMACGLLASKLKSGLAGQYTIVERSNLAGVMKEQDLVDAGLVDAGVAATAGKLLNADAIIFGDVQVQQTEDKEITTETNYTSRGQPYTTTKEKLHRTGQVIMTTKLVRSDTAEVIVSKTSTEGYDSNNRNSFAMFLGDSSDIPSRDYITRWCLERCVEDFYKAIAPHVEVLEMKLAGGKSEQAKLGINLAKAGEYQQAAEMFAEGIQVEPEDHGSMYNLAVMKMLGGDPDGAKASVDQAMRMKADKKYVQLCQYLRTAQGNQVTFRPASGEEIASSKSRQKMMQARMR